MGQPSPTEREMERIRAYKILNILKSTYDIDWERDMPLRHIADTHFAGDLLRTIEHCEPIVRAGLAEWCTPLSPAQIRATNEPWSFGGIRLRMQTVLLLDLMRADGKVVP